MNMKSLLFAALVALGFTSIAGTASAGDGYRYGSSYRGGCSRAYVQPYYRSCVPVRRIYTYGCAPRYYNCAPRYYESRCYSGYPAYSGYYDGYYGYPGYYGGGVALRVGPVVFGGSSRGYCRY